MEGSKYKLQLQIESENLDPSFEHAARLVSQELERLESGAPPNSSSSQSTESIAHSFLHLHTDKPIKLTVRVKIPDKENPKFNFVGKLLGPKGNSLKRLQNDTGTKMSILGKGSMRDKNKEDELRKEGGKYAHLNDELHVLIEVFSEATDAYARMSHAMTEVKKFLIPEHHDDIGEQQRQEMMYLNGGFPERGRGVPPRGARGGRGGPPRGRGAVGGLLATPGGRGGVSGPGSFPSRGAPRGVMSRGASRGRGAMRPPAPAPPPVAPMQTESYEEYGNHYSGVSSHSMPSGYDDGSYAEQGYGDGYGQSYGAQAADTQYFDYGHGNQSESYDEGYGDSQWGGAPLKAPAPRGRGQYRSHPYGAGRGSY